MKYLGYFMAGLFMVNVYIYGFNFEAILLGLSAITAWIVFVSRKK